MISCPRTGCEGVIDEDGFCDVCGLEPPAIESAQFAEVASGSAGRGSHALQSSSTSPSGPWTSGSASSRSASGAARRGMLGAGLVEMPQVAYRDPSSVVLKNPRVPEERRFCSRCGGKVGRTVEGRPGRTEGFCSNCGQRFSFTPKLFEGQLVHGQYEVLGCLAHGGLGWIYLAKDRAVSDRWVVLKGLLDTGDADAMSAAMAERHFLAKVEHPNIVKIHNFVQYRDQHGDTVGYIVMEYVGGRSLKDMIKQRRAELGPRTCLPLDQAIAYTIEMLRPIGYLHSIGLLFCDLKPDNVIQTQEQLKLIDLGAVRHDGDTASSVYGTIGYQAPEVERLGPSPASDLYAVGRSLAVMSFAFDFQKRFRDRLPTRFDVGLLGEYDSFDRLLRRATAEDRALRFSSAEEMAEQLTGVLREVLASADGQARPGTSAEFAPERRGFGVRQESAELDLREIARGLPVPRVDGTDPAAALLATVGSDDPEEVVETLRAEQRPTEEVRLRLVRAYVELGDGASARATLEPLLDVDSQRTHWRAQWHNGLAQLADGNAHEAAEAFDTVLNVVPGELAPKLAIAACAECLGDHARAEDFYRTVWRTDRSFVSAAFGLARTLLARGESAEAAEVLGSIPETSSHHVTAQLMAVRAATSASDPRALTEQDLVRAGEQLSRLELDPGSQARMSAEVLETALRWRRLDKRPSPKPVGKVLDRKLVETDLRQGLEQCYRTLARQATDESERIALVDRANRVRPRTWV